MNKWINDSECNKCCKCKKYFHLFRRKHHCRKCGFIYCHECLNDVVYYGLKTKICNICKNNKTYYEYIIEQLNIKDKLIIYLKTLLENKNNTQSQIENKNKNQPKMNTISTQTDSIEENHNSTENVIDSTENVIDSSENVIDSCESKKNNFNILNYLKTLK